MTHLLTPCLILTLSFQAFTSSAADLNIDSNGNLVTNPNAWRDLSDRYSTEVRDLRRKRAERGETLKTLEDELSAIDFAKTSKEAEKELAESLEGIANSLGDAASAYFKGPGKRDNVLEAGATILTETLPDLSNAYDAMFAEVDLHFEMERLESEIVRHEREVKAFDSRISQLEDNIRAADEIARFMDSDLGEIRSEVLSAADRIQNNASAVRAKAQTKVDTIPEGWTECSCPNAHSNVGRIIHGKRYHGPAMVCPPVPP